MALKNLSQPSRGIAGSARGLSRSGLTRPARGFQRGILLADGPLLLPEMCIRDRGNTAASAFPLAVGSSTFLRLSPARSISRVSISFSRMAARVAGVPMPLCSAPSGISSLPAVSIACKRVPSVWCAGGVVCPSAILALGNGHSYPSPMPSGRVGTVSYTHLSRVRHRRALPGTAAQAPVDRPTAAPVPAVPSALSPQGSGHAPTE